MSKIVFFYSYKKNAEYIAQGFKSCTGASAAVHKILDVINNWTK